jgi:hypothetical protein
MIPPQLLAIGGAAALLTGFVGGWQVRDWKCQAAQAEALEQADQQRDRLQRQVEDQATRHERDRADASRRAADHLQSYRTVYRDRLVPGDCAGPDDARRVLERAVADANAQAAGEPGGAVPEPAQAAGAADRP